MNNKAHLRPKDYDNNGDIIPSGWKEEKGDLISREALKKQIKDSITEYGNTYSNDLLNGLGMVLQMLDNAPTVSHERLQGDCEKCDFRKFTETFIDGVVDVMNKNGITSVEQLSKILKGGAYEQ